MSSSSTVFPRPTGSLKRKLNDPTTSFSKSSSKKAPKHNEHDSPRGWNGAASDESKAAYVQDEPEDGDEDQEAGPALPPDEDNVEDDEPEDDEEGRFFGGGVTKEEKNVLDFIDENEDGQPEETVNLAWLKRTALNFERKITKNAELRAKYEHDPMKFVSSEADLDAEVKSLSLLSEHPELYKDFVRSGCSGSLVGLLAHDNTDIAIAACEVIAELIDEDSEVPAEDWSVLVKSMLKAEIVDLLVSNLHRLDETNESDSAGVYHVLNVLENLLSDSANADSISLQSKLLEWLLQRVNRADDSAPNKVGQNRQYAAEILVILAQNHDRNASRLVKIGAVDTLLQLLSTWRRRDPEKDSDEEEFAENLFDCLVTLCKDGPGCRTFIEDEGVELCLIMIKEGKFSKKGALRVLDHAAGGPGGPELCERIVEAGGLKPLFTTFMKSKKLERESSEHLISIFSSMLRFLPGSSAARIRTLAKFVEKEYEKCRRLLEIRKDYMTRLTTVQAEIDADKRGMAEDEVSTHEDEWLLRKIDAGLFPLQTLNTVIAWLIAEDDGARKFFAADAEGRSSLVDEIRASLKEQIDGLDVEASSEAVDTRDMLDALIKAL